MPVAFKNGTSPSSIDYMIISQKKRFCLFMKALKSSLRMESALLLKFNGVLERSPGWPVATSAAAYTSPARLGDIR